MRYQQLLLSAIVFFFAGMVVATFSELRKFLPGFFDGALVTIQITIGGIIVAVLLAFPAALAKMFAPWPLRWIAITYIEIFRGTSALVQLFWLFFVLPHFGVNLDPMTVAILALGLNSGAYGAEVVRGAVASVTRDQWEASTALNMTRTIALRRIIIPQALVRMIPPWGNIFIELLKLTSLVSLITISDLTFKAQQMNQITYQTFEIYAIVLVFYFSIAYVITIAMGAFEKHCAHGINRGRA